MPKPFLARREANLLVRQVLLWQEAPEIGILINGPGAELMAKR